jgi:hypothetical protein
MASKYAKQGKYEVTGGMAHATPHGQGGMVLHRTREGRITRGMENATGPRGWRPQVLPCGTSWIMDQLTGVR